jgi:hypothetical protein
MGGVQSVANTVRDSVLTFSEGKHFSFSSRIKGSESLAEKLEGGRFGAWSAVDDLFACTVVVPTQAREVEVIEFLQASFEQVALRERNRTQKPPEVFRFDGTRFIGRLRELPGLNRPAEAYRINFEVQIPTAFEYAWQTVTHELVYKGGGVSWARSRLAAQLRALVEQVDLFVDNFETMVASLSASTYPEVDAREYIASRFQDLVEAGLVPRELQPASWSRFSENVFALVRSVHGRRAAPAKTRDFVDGVARVSPGDRSRWYEGSPQGGPHGPEAHARADRPEAARR